MAAAAPQHDGGDHEARPRRAIVEPPDDVLCARPDPSSSAVSRSAASSGVSPASISPTRKRVLRRMPLILDGLRHSRNAAPPPPRPSARPTELTRRRPTDTPGTSAQSMSCCWTGSTSWRSTSLSTSTIATAACRRPSSASSRRGCAHSQSATARRRVSSNAITVPRQDDGSPEHPRERSRRPAGCGSSIHHSRTATK